MRDIPRMLSKRMSAGMGFRRADWPEREAKRTSVREPKAEPEIRRPVAAQRREFAPAVKPAQT